MEEVDERSVDVIDRPWDGIFELAPEVDDQQLDVAGTLPEGVRGTLFLNAAGDVRRADHLFDADALVHRLGFRSEDGRAEVCHRARYIQTEKRRRERERPVAMRERAFGSQAHSGKPFPNVARRPLSSALGQVIARSRSELWNFNESGKPHAVDPLTLETIGELDFEGVPRRERMIGHGYVDPATAECFMLAAFYGWGRNYLAFYRHDERGRTSAVGQIRLKRPYLVHDFAVTENWLVCPVWPWRCGSPYMSYFGAKSFAASCRWDASRRSIVFLVPRNGLGPVRAIETDPMFAFHLGGAHEEDGDVVLNVSKYERFLDLWPQYASFRTAGFAGNGVRAIRLRLAVKRNRCTVEEIGSVGVEDPVYDPRPALGSPHDRIFGLTQSAGRDGLFTSIAALDTRTGHLDQWVAAPGQVCGQPRFVGERGRSASESGWLVAPTYDPVDGGGLLVVLSATDIEAGPVATASVPTKLGFVFHSWWADADGQG